LGDRLSHADGLGVAGSPRTLVNPPSRTGRGLPSVHAARAGAGL